MLRNYLTTAWRNLTRKRGYTLVNIAGLAIGIGSALLIFLIVQFELSFDNFHQHKDRIYRLVSVPYKPGSGFPDAGVPLPVAQGLRIDYPQLEGVAAIFGRDAQITIPAWGVQPEKKFEEERSIYFAEPTFFAIFHFPWLAGDPKTVLSAPNQVALTRKTAEKYFGDWTLAMGKIIKYDNSQVFQVAGILQDPPDNSDFPLRVVVSYLSLKGPDLTDWVGTFGRGYCFVRLPEGMSAAKFNDRLHEFVKKHKPAGRVNDGILLQPLSAMHFDAAFDNFTGRTFSKSLISALSLVALFLIILACVNFINLATAQAVNRSKEIGIRKVLGSKRSQLLVQFLGETGLLTFFAVLVAIGLASLVLPALNNLLQIHAIFDLSDPRLLAFLLILTVSVTALSGFYPALRSSGFSPIHAFRSKGTGGSLQGISLRRVLVILQFCIAQILIIGVLVMLSQLNFFRQAPLGFDKESIVDVPIPNDSASVSRLESVRQDLLRLPGIHSLSFSTLKEYVVNETLVRKLGISKPQDILGKEINFWDQKRGPVVGVVKDFNTNSLQNPIVPAVIGCWKDAYQMIGIKMVPGKERQTLASIEKIWNAAYPDYVYTYTFLDDKISDYYQEEGRISKVYTGFAAIAIFISCLGLYGLLSFLVTQRVKELGIRKVLGASVSRIMILLSREFTILIGIAFLIAAPLAFYFAQHWLEGFSFHIKPGILLFLTAVLGSVAVAWFAVGWRAYRAAVSNPIDALRNE